jgi:hypothetical protein
MPNPQDAALNVEWWDIDRVTPYRKNPRHHSDASVAKIASSIVAFGWRQPIVVDDKGVVILGTGRLLAAEKLALAQVPVHQAASLTVSQVKALRIADNRVAQESSWDFNLLNQEIEDLTQLGFELEWTGLDPDELSGAGGLEKTPGEGGASEKGEFNVTVECKDEDQVAAVVSFAEGMGLKARSA